ncbi:hypothetical protein HY642_06930 [Candidatus Woesearchaeota archaeon]|nr:hypothetical protein [Candidatus Woesearchaeota archaeon]
MKRRHKPGRKGLEIAMSFIVMLIITIVVFGGSIYFIKKLFTQTEEARAQLDEETQQQINALIAEGEPLVIPIVAKTVKAGTGATYGLGIKNVLNAQKLFYVRVGYSASFQQDTEKKVADVVTTVSDTEIGDYINTHWLLYNHDPISLKNNEQKQTPIKIQSQHNIADGVRIVPGLYIFNVCVLQEEPATDYSCSNNDVKNSLTRGRTARRNPCAGPCSDPLLYRNQALKIQLVVT